MINVLITGAKNLRDFFREMVDSYTPSGALFYLFGSYSKKLHRPDSDVDLLIVTKKHMHSIIATHLNDFLLETGILVSAIFLSPAEFENVKNLSFFKEIIKEGIKLE